MNTIIPTNTFEALKRVSMFELEEGLKKYVLDAEVVPTIHILERFIEKGFWDEAVKQMLLDLIDEGEFKLADLGKKPSMSSTDLYGSVVYSVKAPSHVNQYIDRKVQEAKERDLEAVRNIKF